MADPKRPYRDAFKQGLWRGIAILAWAYGRFDDGFDAAAGIVTKWFCGWSGRSNFYLAKMLVAAGAAVYAGVALWDLARADSLALRIIIVLFAPWLVIAAVMVYKDYDRQDKTPPTEVVMAGRWSIIMKNNRLFWMILGTFMMMPPPRPFWLFVGFAGYVAGHHNRGGKSVLQRAKERLREKLQVLVPSPAPA